MLSHPEIEKDAGRIMSIHTKIGILLFCAAVGIASAGIYAQHRITLPGFISLEQDEAVKNIQRVIAATDNEIEYLCSTCKDWSSWDDTYDFIQSADQKYIEANLQIDTFENNRLNLIYFCNDEGRVIWGEMRNEFSGDVVGVRQFPINALPETHPLLIRHPLKKKIRGNKRDIYDRPRPHAGCRPPDSAEQSSRAVAWHADHGSAHRRRPG